MPSISKWIKTSRDDLVYDVAERSLRARLDAVSYYLPLAAEHSEKEVEYIHQMRVWSRRAVAAVRLYRDLLPWSRSAKIKKSLSQIRESANDARDDDVLILRLEQDQTDTGASHLLDRVRDHRVVSQETVVAVFAKLDGGEKFRRRAKKLLKSTNERGKTDKLNGKTFHRWARKNLRPYVEDFFHTGKADLTDLEALHKFRISGKKLRYTMELLGGAFPAPFTDDLYPKVESLQDRLGEINDYASARGRYMHWLKEADGACEEEYLKRLMEAERELLEQRRVEFLDWWTDERANQLFAAFDRIIRGPKFRRDQAAGKPPSKK